MRVPLCVFIHTRLIHPRHRCKTPVSDVRRGPRQRGSSQTGNRQPDERSPSVPRLVHKLDACTQGILRRNSALPAWLLGWAEHRKGKRRIHGGPHGNTLLLYYHKLTSQENYASARGYKMSLSENVRSAGILPARAWASCPRSGGSGTLPRRRARCPRYGRKSW